MNEDTCVAVFCYAGDAELVQRHSPQYFHHCAPVVVLSPKDSPVLLSGADCYQAGERAYIGQASIDRQRAHLKLLLERRHEKYFLLCDADSFIVSAKIPDRLYRDSNITVWSNECFEPRPHASIYEKIAMQPPYWLTRDSIERLLAAPIVPLHPITPYIDHWWVQHTSSAGLVHRPFTLLEQECNYVFKPVGPEEQHCWQMLDYRIRYRGAVAMHPIKTQEQHQLCVDGRKEYERAQS